MLVLKLGLAQVLFGQWCELLAKVSLCYTTLPLPIMSFEEISDFFRRNWKILTVTRLEESEVVMQRAEAFHVLINRSVQVSEVYLGDLVRALQLKFILEADYIFKELGELEASIL